MKDEELLARKKRLSAILLHRLNRHFYPLACRSFSLDALSIDQAFAGVAAGLSARDRSMVVRMYVHFRLALAEMFLETEAEGSSFLSGRNPHRAKARAPFREREVTRAARSRPPASQSKKRNTRAHHGLVQTASKTAR